ncbi:c-type cytochrome [bacterium]|jgi:putative membrane-bound dehydrogenase-like protein|nr:c-type cytochrome [bacterium]
MKTFGMLSLILFFAFGASANDLLKFDFPIYQNKPAGKQVGGNREAASTPALSPEAAQRQFTVPEGFEVRLFAAEPMVVNPVTMTWDERGRLWVLELYEYPSGAPEGTKGRDRIKILEDTDADGRADKVHVWADGMSLATGLILGDGGAYVGQAPHLLHLKDTDGDDRADSREIVMTGFGLEDRHELLNGFTWGPDGYLYMTHGVFTHSKVKNPDDPNDDGVIMNAAVARFHPRTKKFEVFADGTSNPWGVDFDAKGNAFVSACVIDHLFHLAPGGLYSRQAGQATNPYAYELLPSIVDHRHHMAAYSGVQVYLGDKYPEEYVGKVMMGNIHDNAVHADMLTPKGSSFVSSEWQDFLRSDGDGWFRPVSEQVGPDGNLWIADWYDKYPCYQNARADPEGVDRVYGRIWRVVYTGGNDDQVAPSRNIVDMNLAALSSGVLTQLLGHKNIWHRKMAQRLLSERGEEGFGEPVLHPETPIHKLFENGTTLEARLTALWALHGTGLLRAGDLSDAAEDSEPAIRAWVARLIGERGYAFIESIDVLSKLAADPDPTVRLAVAVACRQFVSGSLTVNTPPRYPLNEVVTGGVLSELFKASAGNDDPTLHFLIWMALEPLIEADPMHAVLYYEMELTKKLQPLASKIMRKMMRRVSDMGDDVILAQVAAGLNGLGDGADEVLVAALEGLVEGQRGRVKEVDGDAIKAIGKLSQHENGSVASLAQQLGTIWGDASALKLVLETLVDEDVSQQDRLRAIEVAGQNKTNVTREALMDLVASDASNPLKVAAVQALTNAGDDSTSYILVKGWRDYSPSVRRAVATLCTARREWRWPLFNAVEKEKIAPGEVPPKVIRALANARERGDREKTLKFFGRVNKTSAEKRALIAKKRRMVLEGKADLAKGHELAKTACLVCHKLYDEGAEIGPDLTGVGRSSLNALLSNVIDPNEIIGQGYENVIVETKDGRTLSGRLVEETDTRIKLVNLGPIEYVVAKDQIVSRTVSEMSLMPEGLDALPDEDFRNLIWYILTPPEDGPVTEERRHELIGGEHEEARVDPRIDGESVALWNPVWQVLAPEFEGTPRKHVNLGGHKNVLETHPYDDSKPAALEAVLEISAAGAFLDFEVASHERGDWELRVFVQGKLLKRAVVNRKKSMWQTVSVDLSNYAGKNVSVRAENVANGWEWEFGYWSRISLRSKTELSLSR